MKDRKVCEGCKYRIKKGDIFVCDYCLETGHSRLMVEQANGGWQKDRCVCYEKGEHKNRGINAYGKKVGGRGEG